MTHRALVAALATALAVFNVMVLVYATFAAIWTTNSNTASRWGDTAYALLVFAVPTVGGAVWSTTWFIQGLKEREK